VLLISLLISFLRGRIGEVLVRGDLGSNQINVRHLARSRSVPTSSFGVKPVWIKVSVKLIFSLVSSEEEKYDHDQGEDRDGTSDYAASNGSSIRGRRSTTTTTTSAGWEDELSGPHCLRFDLAVRVSGYNDRAEHDSRGG